MLSWFSTMRAEVICADCKALVSELIRQETERRVSVMAVLTSFDIGEPESCIIGFLEVQ
jgi:hypothetical protein